MVYARIKDNILVEYPLFEGDIKLRFANVSFSDPFTPPEGYVIVEDTPPPVINYTQNVSEAKPQLVHSKWTRIWVVTDASQEEIVKRVKLKTDAVTKIRDNFLKICDWTQLEDSPLSPSAKLSWASYREQLRKIAEQPDYPWTVVWPQPPSD